MIRLTIIDTDTHKGIELELRPADLELPAAEFARRYLEPALWQMREKLAMKEL